MRSRWLRVVPAVAAVLAVVLSGPVWFRSAAAGDFTEQMAKANESYEGGEYAQALEIYERLVEEGAVDPDLFYNLGNAYYKEGQPGRAVLYYKRALRLAPRDNDARTNLQLVSFRPLFRIPRAVSTPTRSAQTRS